MKLQDLGSPNGTYVAVKYTKESLDKIEYFMTKNKIQNSIDLKDIHTTVVYSRIPIPNIKSHILHDFITKPIVTPIGFEIFNEKCLVMLLQSHFLNERFFFFKKMGASYDFPSYKPHITLSYEYNNTKKDFLWDQGNLEVDLEYSEDLSL